MASDVELLEAWRGGDASAGEALVSRHFDALMRFFRNKTGAAIDDLIQRTFLSCVESKDRIRDGASFRAYLFRIARNELYDQMKRNYRESAFDPDSVSIAALEPTPSMVVAEREEQRMVLAALRALPLELQVLLELHYWERMTAAELAAMMSTPVGTAKTRIRRAKELLREQIEAHAQSPSLASHTISSLDAWAASLKAAVGPLVTPRRA